jgi:hypothetical protein
MGQAVNELSTWMHPGRVIPLTHVVQLALKLNFDIALKTVSEYRLDVFHWLRLKIECLPGQNFRRWRSCRVILA